MFNWYIVFLLSRKRHRIILAFALIAAISTLTASEIVHEGLIRKDQGGNMTQDQGEENGGMTEGQTDPKFEVDVDLGTG